MAGKTRNGRPPKYTRPGAMHEVVDRYFEERDGKLLTDEGGNPVLNRSGAPVIEGKKPPTIPGLALALGFRSRQSLLNYQAKRDFQDIISDAKLRVEEYTEERLLTGKGKEVQCSFCNTVLRAGMSSQQNRKAHRSGCKSCVIFYGSLFLLPLHNCIAKGSRPYTIISGEYGLLILCQDLCI